LHVLNNIHVMILGDKLENKNVGYYIGLCIALIVGILVGQDASTRGMNAWGWGIGVFLLMIVFLPLYFILRKPKNY